MPRQHSYHTPQEYQAAQAPGISIHHVGSSGNPHPSSGLPGSLQSGRPGASSAVTAPSGVPTLPPLQNPYQPNSSSRPATASQTHNYSRSSPAGLDQPKYAPFIPTPDGSSYPSTPSHRYKSSQSGQADSLYSPLALADVRALENGGLDPQASTPFPTEPTVATNSNYLAPWPVYAFDWCKWPVPSSQGDSAGKMAIGSYVEDGHNYVRFLP